MKKWPKILGIAALMALCCVIAGCGAMPKPSLVIASKQFTENILLSEIYAQLVEGLTDIPVERKQNFGATAACFTAMSNKEIDMYVEYTGTIAKEILQYELDTDISEEQLLAEIRRDMEEQYQIYVYPPIGPNNTYALGMLRKKAAALGVKSMSDLQGISPKLVFAANDIFYTRANDGYDTMVELYGLSFKSTVKMTNPLLYQAVLNDLVDVIMVYATDSQLPKHDMIILEDDRNMFPAYYALPLISRETVITYPELEQVLQLLTDTIDDKTMGELNYQVDIEGQSPAQVAAGFLQEQGLLP